MIRRCYDILCIFLLLTIEFGAYTAIADGKSSGDIKEENQESEQNLEKADQKIEQVHQVKRVLIYKQSNCPNCDNVKDELKKHNIEYQDIDLTWNHKQKIILQRKAGKDHSSYVFIGNEYIGNHEELMHLMKHGKLFRMLQGNE